MKKYSIKLIGVFCSLICFAWDNSFAATTSEEDSKAFKIWCRVFDKTSDMVLTGTQCGVSHPLVSYERFLGHISAGSKVLDVGGGAGFFAKEALKVAGEVTVVDIDEATLKELEKAQPAIFVRAESVLDLKDSNAYDSVFSSYMLQFIEPPLVADAIGCMVQALVPGGKLMIALPPFQVLVERGNLMSLLPADKTGPVTLRSDSVYTPRDEEMIRELPALVDETLQANGQSSNVYLRDELIRRQTVAIKLSDGDKARLIDKYGDKAKYAFNMKDYVPTNFTYIDRTILQGLLEDFGLKDIEIFDMKDEKGNVKHLGAIATKPAE